jgi:hypothetical protein
MSVHRVSGFLIEIDRKEQGFHEDLDYAKQVAPSLENGVSSIMIKSVNPNNVPSSAWCWDYEKEDWEFYQNAALAQAK